MHKRLSWQKDAVGAGGAEPAWRGRKGEAVRGARRGLYGTRAVPLVAALMTTVGGWSAVKSARRLGAADVRGWDHSRGLFESNGDDDDD